MLRAATVKDSKAVVRVLVKSRAASLPYALSPHSPSAIEVWVEHELIPRGGVTVAVEADEIVAVCAISEDNGTAWIEQLYVLPGFENKGLGSSLLRLVHSKWKGPVRLFTFQQNAGARRFYERHGYKILAFSDGQDNEEKCPDVLYERSPETEA